MMRSKPSITPIQITGRDLWIALATGLVVVGLVLSMRPILGIPRNDDFSYARTAESLAKTGHIAYNGWGSPLMLPQAAIGAALIKLFGFSYYILDWFGVACAGACAGTLYYLCRLAGLDRGVGFFVVAIVVANPMYLATASTFMTDIPSLLLMLLALCALVISLQTTQNSDRERRTELKLIPMPFWVSVLLAIIAGSNRQLSWVVYLGALLPIFLVARSRQDRLMVAGGSALVLGTAASMSWWLAQQPLTVPTNIVGGLVLLVAFTDAIFAVAYRFFFIFGLFILPVVLVCLDLRDIRRPRFWGVLAVTAVPLLFPVSKKLGYFTTFYGAAPSGQYFTSAGVKVGYLIGERAINMPVVPSIVLAIWIAAGVLALGISLHLMIDWYMIRDSARRAKQPEPQATVPFLDYRLKIIATTFLVSTLVEIIVSIPWFAQLHVFDRYFLFYLPGFAIYFMAQRTIRTRGCPANPVWDLSVKALTTLYLASMAIFAYALTATYDNFGRAQANLYHRLIAKGVPPQQIDNGLEFDADAQVRIAGHINSNDIIPKSAYDPDAVGHNIPSATPGLFPVMDGHFIFSLSPHPPLKFSVDADPVDSESYASYLPPGQRTVYVLHVSD